MADSKQTLLCTYLSAVLLVGLGLNSLFGWSWADPIAAVVIAGLAVKEGIEAWRGDTCCEPIPSLTATGRARIAATHVTVGAREGVDGTTAARPEGAEYASTDHIRRIVPNR